MFYFREDVDIYENREIVSNEGTWQSGINETRAGLLMSGTILLGSRYFQEIAPKGVMNRAEIVSINKVVEIPFGEFENCLKTKETTPLESGCREFKFYAPGIGPVKDGMLKLTEANEFSDKIEKRLIWVT